MSGTACPVYGTRADFRGDLEVVATITKEALAKTCEVVRCAQLAFRIRWATSYLCCLRCRHDDAIGAHQHGGIAEVLPCLFSRKNRPAVS